tara:strand:- start:2713 stop:3408 length:696 start_codon:yes stop_codon:yes gene_type:complete
MNAYSIVIPNNKVSFEGYETLIKSSEKVKNDFEVEKFDAVTADLADTVFKGNGLKWNYPWEGETTDLTTGLVKRSYPTTYKERRMACFASHYLLWYKSFREDVPILVLEHDAVFVHKLDPDPLIDSKYDVIGINNPLMATRRAKKFFDTVKGKKEEIQPIPDIDDFNVPQGLAGNSAYIIKPKGAEELIMAVEKYGAWPNDAIMCKQLIPNMGVTRRFYTKVQGLPSTTTG